MKDTLANGRLWPPAFVSIWRRLARPVPLTGCALALLALFGFSPRARAIDLPPGFVAENVAPGAVFDTPVGLAFFPGGRMLVAEKRGRLFIVNNGVKRSTPLWSADSEVLNMMDRGFLDVAVDPNYSVNHYIYLLYTVDPPGGTTDGDDPGFGRIERWQVSFTDSNALVPGSRLFLMGATWPEGPPSGSSSHTIGSLRWGRDGSLMVSCGEGASFNQMDDGGYHPSLFGAGKTDPSEDIGAFRAQSLSSLGGKVLRINPANGQGYPSNPYYDGNANSDRSRIWAYGFRNPYRFTVKPGTGSTNPSAGNPGTLYLGDVGWTMYEELNVVRQAGQNFGWPCYEGFQYSGPYHAGEPAHNDCYSVGSYDNPASFSTPLATWEHVDPNAGTPALGFVGSCVIGGTFYNGTRYPAQYRDAYFFGDYVGSWIKVAVTDANDNLIQILPFATGMEGGINITKDPTTGDLLYITLNASEVRRIRYVGGAGNDPPFASANANPMTGSVPLDATFSSAGSYDPDNDPLTYDWDFGDGGTSNQPSPQHTYFAAGVYQALLTVDDGNGGTDQSGVSITVGTQSTPFPSASVLDNFNRANGAIGSPWVADNASLTVASSQLVQVGADASTVWNGASFGPSQEVFVRLSQITSAVSEHDLMLKVQGQDWSAGHIEVKYDVTASRIYVTTYHPVQGWAPHGSVSVTLSPGDQFGARADGAGTVGIFVNGTLIMSTNVATWPFYAQGGRLGMTIVSASGSRFDDFGGGNVVAGTNTPPEATILTPANGTFYAAGDTVRLSCEATDAEQPAASLAYHWDVNLHHNTHVHPSSYSTDTPTGQFAGEDHDDGTGVWLDIVLRVTDSGGLADTVHTAIYPETDLEPSAVSVLPDSPNTGAPARYQFTLWNHGRMPTPFSHWVLRAGAVTLAQGDTVVAARDSVKFDLWVPPLLAAGNYSLRLVVDSLAVVHETNETNNATTRPLWVVAPTLDAPGEHLDFELSEGFPNPSTGPVGVSLALPRASRVEMEVLDLQGREVWRTVPRTFAAGRWTLEWPGLVSGRRARPGLYLARVSVDGRTFTRRLAIVH